MAGKLDTNKICEWIDKANAVAKAINDAGGQATAIPGDMLNAQYIDELVKKAAEFGGGKIHIIVNNAGFTWDGVIHKVREIPIEAASGTGTWTWLK